MQEKRKKGMVDIFKDLFFVACIVLAIIAGTVIYKAKKYPNNIPDILGIKPFIVFTNSMEPVYSEGDLVFTKMIDTSTIQEGDIISFRNVDDAVITHRVIQIVEQNGEKFYKTKGDASLKEDEGFVNIKQIEGVYVSKIPKVGKIIYEYQKPIVFLFVLLTILAVGLIWVYTADKIDMIREAKQQEKLREIIRMRRSINTFNPRKELEKAGTY